MARFQQRVVLFFSPFSLARLEASWSIAHTVIGDRGEQVAVEIFKLAGVALQRNDGLKSLQCLLRSFEADRPRFNVVTRRCPKGTHRCSGCGEGVSGLEGRARMGDGAGASAKNGQY